MLGSFTRKRAVAAGAAVTVLTALGMSASSVAGAVEIDTTCTTNIGIDSAQSFDFEVELPNEVPPGEAVTVTIPGGDRVFEPGIDLNDDGTPDLAIHFYQGIYSKYGVEGGTIVDGSATASGSPTFNGNPIAPDTPIVTPNSIQTGLFGPLTPLPGTLVTPDVTFDVLPTGVGTPLKITALEAGSSVAIGNAQSPTIVAATCPLGGTLLSTANVVDPPPPGAPNAVSDSATTPQDNAVTIDVLANDEPNAELAIDPTTLSITVPTQSGALADPVDGGIRYTPPIGFNGTDTFSYQICSVPDEDGNPGVCDTATVTVTVEPPVTVESTPTTAAAAPAQLPRTGGSTAPLAGIGGSFLLGGIALVMRNRRQAPRFVR